MAIGTQCVMLTSTVKGLFGKQGLILSPCHIECLYTNLKY